MRENCPHWVVLRHWDSCERDSENHFGGEMKSQGKQPPSCKEVRPAVRMAAVFAGLTCSSLQIEHFAIGTKTKPGHSVCWFISFE